MNKTETVITLFLFGIFSILTSCSNDKENNQQANENDKITQAFMKWTVSAIKAGKYSPADSCNSSYFANHKKNEKLEEGLGLPDKSKFHYLFTDINNDKQLDALVTFHPVCCTCSDTTGKVVPQAQVIIISNQNGYAANDTFFYHLFADSMNINIDIDSTVANQFYGTYFKIGKQDTSVEQYQKSISITFETREMKFIKRKRDKK
ncbi:MAG: hypothetical protein HY841_11940 [Bacteroidetes bacterium]|nr:hypothetical protein [Bacteroidota bacterium]